MAIKLAGKNNIYPCTGTARACGLGHKMHSRYYATTRIYEDGASCRFVVTLRYRLVAASGVGRGGGSWCSSIPFLPQTVQEVYLKG